MADYGMQIYRSDGRWFTSPEYTPLVLVQVSDVTLPFSQSGTTIINTNVPNGSLCMMFSRLLDVDAGFNCYIADGPAGYKQITVLLYMTSNRPNGSTSPFTARFYVFSDFVAYAPDYGIFFYRNGKMVYCGNCLPLQIKTFTEPATDPDINVKKAVQFGFEGLIGSGGAPGTPIANYLILGWSSTAYNGVVAAPYQSISNPSSTILSSPPSLTAIYIETALYDQYFAASLGY